MEIESFNPVTGIANKMQIAADGSLKTSQSSLAASRAGISSNNSAGVASAQILAAGVYLNNVTIQNTHATQTLNLSFTNPATVNDFRLAAGASITLPFGPSNALYAIASGAATTYAIIGA